MGYPPLEDLLPKSNFSVYKLVRMAAIRALELADGKPKLMERPSGEKTPTVALEEIKAGRVVLKDVADQFKPVETPEALAKKEK
ncbi:MAG: DNA-directed RNA polymerase subunit omega [Candidatus Omnitrophica bacterium]|nr:DNA-directed RNA polymerase subunit omega [Candidatus Omnitrophota bacterium]